MEHYDLRLSNNMEYVDEFEPEVDFSDEKHLGDHIREYKSQYEEDTGPSAGCDYTKTCSKFTSPPFTRVATFDTAAGEECHGAEHPPLAHEWRTLPCIVHDEDHAGTPTTEALESAIKACRATALENGDDLEYRALSPLPPQVDFPDKGDQKYDGPPVKAFSPRPSSDPAVAPHKQNKVSMVGRGFPLLPTSDTTRAFP